MKVLMKRKKSFFLRRKNAERLNYQGTQKHEAKKKGYNGG